MSSEIGQANAPQTSSSWVDNFTNSSVKQQMCLNSCLRSGHTHTHTNKANARTHLSNGRAAARARLRARIVHRSEEQSEWPRESTMVQPIPSSWLKKEIGSFSNVQVITTSEQNGTTYKVNCATRSLGDSEVCKLHLNHLIYAWTYVI